MLSNRLKKYSNASCTSATYATPETINLLEVARLAGVQVATSYKSDLVASDEIISNWWLMHFVDCEPIEVAMWPPCNHASAIESYPNAIAAEPVPAPVPSTINQSWDKDGDDL